MRARHVALILALAAAALPGCTDHLANVRPAGTLNPPPPLDSVPGSYLDKGRYYLGVGELDLARRAFVRSLRVEGDSAAALTGLGVTYEHQGLLGEARRFFEHALKLAPDSVVAHNNLGTVYYRMGDFQAARQAFQTAFALSSGQSTVSAHNLGLADRAIRLAAADQMEIAPNPHELQREGFGEYRLVNAQQSATTKNGAKNAR